MPTYLLCHQHEPAHCRFAFAAWRGFASPLRRRPAIASCGVAAAADHQMWWTVDAADATAALAQLPPYVAERATAVQVQWVPVP